jgi:BASS family bile acid:Na+ symporter
MPEQLNLGPFAQIIISVMLVIVMFSVSLETKISDWKNVKNIKLSLLWGCLGQIVLLPAFAFLVIQFMPIRAEVALGLILVCCCPGGNLSNYLTMVAKGNIILSVLMSFSSTVLAPMATPLNFKFWGTMSEKTAPMFQMISVDTSELFVTIVFTILLPFIVGGYIAYKNENLAKKLQKMTTWVGPTIIIIFFVSAVMMNMKLVQEKFFEVFWPVAFLNTLVLISFYLFSRLLKRNHYDSKAISIEIAIQNSGLGLMIILQFFPQQTEMLMIAGIWGLWHMVSGFTLAMIWRKMENKKVNKEVVYG